MPDFEADIAGGVAAETSLTLLGAQREVGHDELPKLYAYPPDRPCVRANFISSLDGGATVEGLSGQLGSPGDRAVFVVLRELADVIVVGAGTVRSEGYSGAHVSAGQRQQRQSRGQSEIPQLAIVTNTGHLDRDLPVFTRTEVPPLILTCTAAAADAARHLTGLIDDVVDCSAQATGVLDVATMLAQLQARGLTRVLTEGGPTLLGAFIEAGLLDELCLTMAPVVVGGAAHRIASGLGQLQTRMHRAHVLTDDAGYLYTRYVKG
ncbi:pyrimidine reductase family protein [Mycobacterium vicinigordonae]|uniref:Pyrimidine reductase family protein n=1 Tax=Mycobacterium vicinigordonae TaxID=1719132 RepID=A0A7D6I3Z0_9MYCO|nr:pyrimidine reductase family protein [Mycobacterium vicinigordonae]QLL09394.1 pyrimidine reductase family protein [Mycobacterium vicinigordonae]